MKYIKKYKEQFSYLIFNLLSYNNIGDYMKVIIIDDDNIIVFLNKFNIKNIDFDSKENIEKNFRNIFLRLKHIYNLNIKGYYNINIYTDKFYGAVLEIEHEDIEYFDYFDNKVDMRVNVVSDSKFLYKIKDIFCLDKTLLNNIYLFKNDYYSSYVKDWWVGQYSRATYYRLKNIAFEEFFRYFDESFMIR